MITDEEKMNMAWDSGSMPVYVSKDKILSFAEAIERAVMKKLGEQDPAFAFMGGYSMIDGKKYYELTVNYKFKDNLPKGNFYAHPLPAQAVPEWTDRSKIAPKRDKGDKILAFGNGYVFEAECDEDGDWCSIGGDYFTHWMPMPDRSMLYAAQKP